MSEWFVREIVDTGRLRLFCFFVFFIGAFVFIRFSVRMIRRRVRWWPGNVTPGGHHVHHVVFGIVFMCVGGVTGLAVHDPGSGWAAASAALFGVGAALVLDEFALVLHLKDVYWSEQGRLSVDVVFIAIGICGLTLLGLKPLGIDDIVDTTPGELWHVALWLLFNLSMTVIALLKGKVWTGMLGLFIGIVSIVGAVRLARPRSPWARRRYGWRKLERAITRERRLHRPVEQFKITVQNVIAGRPAPPAP